jgi:hypothetical protein
MAQNSYCSHFFCLVVGSLHVGSFGVFSGDAKIDRIDPLLKPNDVTTWRWLLRARRSAMSTVIRLIVDGRSLGCMRQAETCVAPL